MDCSLPSPVSMDSPGKKMGSVAISYSTGDLPNPGIKIGYLASSSLAVDSLLHHFGKPQKIILQYMTSGGSRDLPSEDKIYQIARLVLSFVNPYHGFYFIYFFLQKGILIPRIPSFFPTGPLVFRKKNRLLNLQFSFGMYLWHREIF